MCEVPEKTQETIQTNESSLVEKQEEIKFDLTTVLPVEFITNIDSTFTNLQEMVKIKLTKIATLLKDLEVEKQELQKDIKNLKGLMKFMQGYLGKEVKLEIDFTTLLGGQK